MYIQRVDFWAKGKGGSYNFRYDTVQFAGTIKEYVNGYKDTLEGEFSKHKILFKSWCRVSPATYCIVGVSKREDSMDNLVYHFFTPLGSLDDSLGLRVHDIKFRLDSELNFQDVETCNRFMPQRDYVSFFKYHYGVYLHHTLVDYISSEQGYVAVFREINEQSLNVILFSGIGEGVKKFRGRPKVIGS